MCPNTDTVDTSTVLQCILKMEGSRAVRRPYTVMIYDGSTCALRRLDKSDVSFIITVWQFCKLIMIQQRYALIK